MIVLALTSLRDHAQSTYEAYTFTTLAGTGGGYGSADDNQPHPKTWPP